MQKILTSLTLAVTIAVFAAPSATQAQPPIEVPAPEMKGPPEGKVPLYALARQAGLSTLADAIEVAGLQRTLQIEGPLTVFAPTNDAFAALGEETLNAVLSDVDLLTGILLYHVVPREMLATDVLGSTTIEMFNGDEVEIDASAVTINGANILETDIIARNGVVHVIDAVLLPPMDDASIGINLSKSVDSQSWSEVKSQF